MYLVSGQVSYPLCDRGLHGAEVIPQFVVVLAEVLLLLQQGGVMTCQGLFVHMQHRHPPSAPTAPLDPSAVPPASAIGHSGD